MTTVRRPLVVVVLYEMDISFSQRSWIARTMRHRREIETGAVAPSDDGREHERPIDAPEITIQLHYANGVQRRVRHLPRNDDPESCQRADAVHKRLRS